MKQKHLSISQRLRKAQSPEAKKAVALAWAKSWKEDHDELIRDLEHAIRTNDYDLLCIATGQLKAVGQKRFDALPRVLSHLAETPAVESVD
jgi:hypothetical protein